ncbi:hypothetical protein Tco_0084236 [Tanacetum coccineum]
MVIQSTMDYALIGKPKDWLVKHKTALVKTLTNPDSCTIAKKMWVITTCFTKGASPEQTATDLCSSFMCLGQDSSRLDVADKFIFQSSRYVVPTGRVVVPTGRYVVPAGKVIIIVSPGRLSLVPTGRILSPGGKLEFIVVVVVKQLVGYSLVDEVIE